MQEKSLATKQNYDLASIDQMTKMANVLKQHIIKNKLYTSIVGKNYAHVDGWAYAGGLMGIFPRVTKTENLSQGNEKKWKADVELVRMKDGVVMGFGTAICSSAETKKKSFDEYAILSMAQTRAIGKAYRNTIGWVMKLAGQEATPAEEMVKGGDVVKGEVVVQVEDEPTGIQAETGQILKLLKEFGFVTVEKQMAAIGRLTKIHLKDWRMSSSQSKTILEALLEKKHAK